MASNNNIDVLDKAMKIISLSESIGVKLSAVEGRDYVFFSRNGKHISSPLYSVEEAYGWLSAYKEHGDLTKF